MKGDLPKPTLPKWRWTPWCSPHQGRDRGQPQGQPNGAGSLHRSLPEMLGGSADLTGSNLTNTKSTPNLRFDAPGDVVPTRPAVRSRRPPHQLRRARIRHGRHHERRGAARRLHPYGGTFLTFSDYSRNAIRMAALMKQRVIHVFTHDSIGLGEDGPTHQSIEHAASLRLIPNLDVWRPGDTTETAVAWTKALANKHRPPLLLLSRQNLPYAPKRDLDDISRGAYVLAEPSRGGSEEKAQAVIIATGSEVQLALQAQSCWPRRKIAVRVVSMPSTTTFDRQDAAYKRQPCCPRACRASPWKWADRRLVEIRLRRRGRHRHLRRIGARTRFVQALRLHAGERRRHGARRTSQVSCRHDDAGPLGPAVKRHPLRFQTQPQELSTMTINIGINGFGRIGRNVLRAAVQNFSDIEVVAINDLLEPDYLAYMLKYDSVHGRFKGEVSVEGNTLIVNGNKIRLTQERDPAALKWNEVGADIVLESTGLFLDKATAAKHLAAGAKKVILSAPSKDDTPMFVYGVNDKTYAGQDHHLQRVLHHQLPGPRGQGAQRQVGHQARPHDHRARRHRHPKNRGRPQQQRLARRPRHLGKHHSLEHRRGQGRGRGDSRAQQKADRHVLPRAHLRRVGGRPDRGAEQGSQLRRDLRRDEGAVRRRAPRRAGLHRRQSGGHRLPR
jgi:hypothetical protein